MGITYGQLFVTYFQDNLDLYTKTMTTISIYYYMILYLRGVLTWPGLIGSPVQHHATTVNCKQYQLRLIKLERQASSTQQRMACQVNKYAQRSPGYLPYDHTVTVTVDRVHKLVYPYVGLTDVERKSLNCNSVCQTPS